MKVTHLQNFELMSLVFPDSRIEGKKEEYQSGGIGSGSPLW